MYPSHEVSLCQRLAACAIKNNWSRDSVTELLKILRDEGLELPKDARTLLKTPRDVKIFQKCGGDYCYFGIQKGMQQILLHNTLENNCASLVFNIEGLPLFKSSVTQLWPIFTYFNMFDIFIIAIYGGDSKPYPLSEFLQDFINELSNLIQDGFDWNGKHFHVTIKCFL